MYDVVQYSKIKHGYIKELFDFEYCNKADDFTPKMAKLYIKITNDPNYSNYFKFYTCVCVENLMRELKEEEKKMRKKQRKLKKSNSMYSMYDMEALYKKHNKLAYNPINDVNLPLIFNNPTEIFRKNQSKEQRMKNYY